MSFECNGLCVLSEARVRDDTSTRIMARFLVPERSKTNELLLVLLVTGAVRLGFVKANATPGLGSSDFS